MTPLSIKTHLILQWKANVQIEWEHFFRGFINLDWGHVYSATDITSRDNHRMQSEHAVMAVILPQCSGTRYCLAISKGWNAILRQQSDSVTLEIVMLPSIPLSHR
jgi:hypothetical protein